MFLPANDNYAINHITSFYCMTSCIYLAILIGGLFLTDAYYYVGKYSFLPIFSVLMIAELLKVIYTQLIFQKEISFNPKQGFKLLSIVVLLAKRIKFLALAKCIVMLVGMTAVYFVGAILFGAEIFGKHEETLMFSCLLTILTIFPMVLNFGPQAVVHLINGAEPTDLFHQVLHRNIQLSLFGAWLGAFVVPLDWDRPWQEWPIPCCMGALFGFMLSHFLSLIQFFPKVSKKSNLKTSRKVH